MPSPLGVTRDTGGSLPARTCWPVPSRSSQESLPLREMGPPRQDDAGPRRPSAAVMRPDRRPNLMDLKVSIAGPGRECSLCEHRCGTDRYLSRGRCGVTDSRISSQFVHMGRRSPGPILHCVLLRVHLKCVFCQNYDISTCREAGLIIPSVRWHCRWAGWRVHSGLNLAPALQETLGTSIGWGTPPNLPT